jgi:hypothetical protein
VPYRRGLLFRRRQRDPCALFRRHLRDLFEFLHLIFVQFVDLVAAAVDLRLAFVEILFALFHLVVAAVHFGAAFSRRSVSRFSSMRRSLISLSAA